MESPITKTEFQTLIRTELTSVLNQVLPVALAGFATKQDLEQNTQHIISLMMQGFEILNNRIDRLEARLDQMEFNHNQRLILLEDDNRLVKKIITRDLHMPFAW